MEKVAFEQGVRVQRIWASTHDKDTYLSSYNSRTIAWTQESRMGKALNTQGNVMRNNLQN